MTERPYVLLSCAMSVDGRIDSTGEARLVLSDGADLDRVDGERAGCDAIMVGAGTIRRDNPTLLIRSPQRRAARGGRGLPAHPAGVTITASGKLDPAARFFNPGLHGRDFGDSWGGAPGGTGPPGGQGADGTAPGGDGPPGGQEPDETAPGRSGPSGGPARLVYAATPVAELARSQLAGLAEVIDAGDPPRLAGVLADLAGRGVRRLMVEGGASLGSQFLSSGLVDELQLVVAPFFVGDAGAPQFAGPGSYPWGPSSPMSLAEVRQVGGVALLRFDCSELARAAGHGSPAAGGAGGND